MRSTALALGALGNSTREAHRDVAGITHAYEPWGRETGCAVATRPTQS